MAAIRIFTPEDYKKAMVFVDGTNLFYRLRAARLRVPAFAKLFSRVARGQIVRTYLYTTTPHYEAAVDIHGPNCFDGMRVIFGTAVPLHDGNYKEKGVDALLVADLIYHAASRNCDNVTIVSTDVDFVHALKRVEDFGCLTAVLAVCAEAPPVLRDGCDRYLFLKREQLVADGVAFETETKSSETAMSAVAVLGPPGAQD